MKARMKKKAPPLKTIVELNQKYGIGYQARMVMGDMESVFDSEPYTLYDIGESVSAALDEINEKGGYNYKLHEVIQITHEALDANKGRDLASMKFYQSLDNGGNGFLAPAQDIGDGEEILLTGRGTVLCIYFSWVDDRLPKAHEALKRYCEYLAFHGYGKGAGEILDEIDSLNKDDGAEWIKSTYEKYVTDDAGLIKYIMRT